MTGRVGLLGAESVSLRTSGILTQVVKEAISGSMTTKSTPRKDLVFLGGQSHLWLGITTRLKCVSSH